MNSENWVKPEKSVDPSFFDGLPVKVKLRWGETIGHLSVENKTHEGQIQITVSYNSSPFQNTQVLGRFYLTQAQLDDFQANAAACVLVEPSKKSD